jgi:hypothetical protein
MEEECLSFQVIFVGKFHTFGKRRYTKRFKPNYGFTTKFYIVCKFRLRFQIKIGLGVDSLIEMLEQLQVNACSKYWKHKTHFLTSL